MMEQYLLVVNIGSFGSDAVPADLSDSDQDLVKKKIKSCRNW